ncbi:MAG: hypothetical protein H7X94_02695 [Vallitaleaceae bacterium]|nr:hypothetical protein [Vallitaleaceae bacterium]
MKYKKYLAILMVMIFISTTFPVVAAEQDLSSSISLSQLGLLSNTSENELSKPLSRLIGISMILKSLGYTNEDALLVSSQNPFKDLTGNESWGAGWAMLAFQLGITSGKSTTQFAPNDLMTAKEFITFQLRALGYSKDESWNSWLELGENQGLINKSDDLEHQVFTKAKASDVLYKALASKLYNQDGTFVEKLIDEGIVEIGMAGKLGLVSKAVFTFGTATSLNTKIFEVSCSQTVNILELPQMIVKDRSGEVKAIEKVELAPWDVTKRTLLFTLVKEEINGIMLSLSSSASTTTFQMAKTDTIAPRLTSIESIHEKEVILHFTEPIDIGSVAATLSSKFGTQSVVIEKISYYKDAKSIKLTTTTLNSGMTYEIKSIALTDYAGNALTPISDQIFVHLLDTKIAQEVDSARMETTTELIVTFHEAVDFATAINVANYTVKEKLGSKEVIQVLKSEKYQDANGYINDHEVKLTLASYPKSATLYEVEVKDVKTEKGILIDEDEKSVTFVGVFDTEAPVLDAISARATFNLEVELTLQSANALDNATLSNLQISIAEVYGEKALLSFQIKKIDGKTITLTTTSQKAATLYKLTVGPGINDISGKTSTESYCALFASVAPIVEKE